jgi:competence ComEA-like helix-hairpin-helix protein
VREQTRYFGLESASDTVKFGAEATKFTRKALDKPFIMHTSFAFAGGRSAGGRVYAFITTSTGEDLARLLVANGYARAFGVRRKTPGGVHHDEMRKQLEDLELGAAIKLIGIWEETDPDRLAQLRKEQRQEEAELKRVQEEARNPSEKQGAGKQPLIDINKATKSQLQSIRGIGEKRAQRIIDGRKYESMDDVRKVKGIGAEMLKRLRARFYVQ